MGKSQWVSPRNEKWAVHGEGNSKDTKLFSKKKEAWDYAVSVAKNQHSEVIVQGRDGKIRSKDRYGNDPCPPRDTEH